MLTKTFFQMKTIETLSPIESRRLEVLHSYPILNPEKENFLDSITFLASTICETPIALVSLIDENKQWFKSKIGIDIHYTSRAISFCHHTIKQYKLFEVSDALKNEQFASNPLVTGKLKIRFYAGVPLTDPGGFNLGTLCILDNNPKKLSEQQKVLLTKLAKIVIDFFVLKKIKERSNSIRYQLDNFFKLSPDLFCTATTTGFFNKVNAAFQTELGYSESELLATPFINFVHNDDKEKTIEVLRNFKPNSEKTMFFRNRYQCKNGQYIWLSWNALYNEVAGLIYATARNVTQLVKLEDELKQKKELEIRFKEEKLKQFCNIVSGLSHELLNPVNLSIGFADVSNSLLNELNSLKDEESRKVTIDLIITNQQKIIEHGKDIFNILQKMNYNISRSESLSNIDKVDENKIQEINRLCLKFEQIAYDKYKLKHMDFSCEFENNFDEFNPKCCISIAEFGEVLLNLFYNAFEALTEKMKLYIELNPKVKVQTKYFHNKVEINIADNGVSIAQENVNELFTPFYSTKKIGLGNGLGLTTCFSIIKNNYGTISLEKSDDYEKVFKITLPAA